MTSDPVMAQTAWREILSTDASINKYYDYITRQQLNSNLSAIQLKSLNFLKRFQIMTAETHTQAVLKITYSILAKQIDYVSADQLCEILKEQQGLPLSVEAQGKINQSIYKNFLYKCGGQPQEEIKITPAFRCLKGDGTYRHDWACLTDNYATVDVRSCQIAKSRNADPENSDDMLWYCYSKMLDFGRLSRPDCLELTHSFSILGNHLKMNWNCLNRL